MDIQHLDVKDPEVFNKWRAQYDEMSSWQHMDFIERCAIEFPGQQHFTTSIFEKFFSYCQNIRVAEIGGWKGELAKFILSRHKQKSWDNFEVCRTAVQNTVDMAGLPYVARWQDRFDWFYGAKLTDFDVVVSSNCIEHLSTKHLIKLLDAIDTIKFILFEAPLLDKKYSEIEAENWNGYWGTHILGMTWADVCEEMLRRGYRSEEFGPNCYLFEKVPNGQP